MPAPKIMKNPFVWAFVIGIVSLTGLRQVSLWRRSAPPPLVVVGEWQLTGDNEEPFGSQDLKGKVMIADFMFTRCPTICPTLTANMLELRKRFAKVSGQVHFVSFSVDPKHDTPQVLSAYKKQFGIVGSDWTFVTGSEAQMRHLIIDQMKFHLGEKEQLAQDASLFDIAHVAEFALYDQNGDYRGKFGTDPTGLAAMERAAKFLIEKGPNV